MKRILGPLGLTAIALALVFGGFVGAGVLLATHDRTWAEVLGVVLGIAAGLAGFGVVHVATEGLPARPLLDMLVGVLLAVIGTGTVLGLNAWHQARYGQLVAAAVTEKDCRYGYEEAECRMHYRVSAASTGRDLGWAPDTCRTVSALHVGDPVTVLVDPDGWFSVRFAPCGRQATKEKANVVGWIVWAVALMLLQIWRGIRGPGNGVTIPRLRMPKSRHSG